MFHFKYDFRFKVYLTNYVEFYVSIKNKIITLQVTEHKSKFR